MPTVFIQNYDPEDRIAYRIRDRAKAYAKAKRAKYEGNDLVVVADNSRTKYEEARLDKVTGEVTFHKVHPPGSM